jgi:conjugal transfer mating pair stabilization protein TraN
MLDKVLQLQGRKQLGLNFGSGGSPNCRGLTLTEMQRIDWEQVDFTEFIEDFKGKFFGKYQSPNPDEIAGRVNSSMPGIRKGDDDPLAPPSNMTGWSSNIPDEPEE